ncbi:MAG: hypothetical protein EA398_13550, partial [Deltaproteobacteria bacterium]
VTEGPVTEGPVTEGPVTEGPVTEGPVTEGPGSVGCTAIEVPPFDGGGATTPSASAPTLSGFPQATFSAQSREFTNVPVAGNYRYDVLAYWPQESPPTRRPVVIFEHGFQLAASDFSRYGEVLAEHGFVAILPSTKDSGGLIPSSRDHNLLADDLSFVIDWVLSQGEDAASPLRGRIDPCRIGAGGHSRGGKAAIWAAINDDRVLASWNLDPVDAPPQGPGGIAGTSPAVAPELMVGFTIPGFFVGTGLGPQGGGALSPACAPADENWSKFFESAAGPVSAFVLTQHGHNDFVERCHGQSGGFIPNECTVCPAGEDEAWAVRFTSLHQVAFYKVYLEGDATYRPWLDGEPVREMGGWVDDFQRRNAID